MIGLKIKEALLKLCNNTVRTKDFTFSGRKTIPNAGYLKIATPAGLRSYKVIAAVITTWDANSGAVTLALGSGNAIFIFGASGAYIENMQVRISYVAS